MTGLRAGDVISFLSEGLQDLGYGTTNPDVNETLRTMPLLDPGPFTIQALWKKSASALLFPVLGNGMGLRQEGLYDMPFITVRAIGLQNNFSYAETLAYDVDQLLLAIDSNYTFGSGARVLFINRTGGPPQLVDFDSANRYHFQATYITEAKR